MPNITSNRPGDKPEATFALRTDDRAKPDAADPVLIFGELVDAAAAHDHRRARELTRLLRSTGWSVVARERKGGGR